MKKIHVVFKTHLDIGFTDLAENVVHDYLTHFIPLAVKLAKQNNKFIWTVGSWLIDYYLTSEEVTQQAKQELIVAIENGNINWHGLPVTMHSELNDQRLFEYGLSLSQKLDQQFGKTTIAGKMTDVTGHTLGIVPLMAQAGLKYLHIGVNPSSAIPDVPPMFVWRAPDGSQVIVQYDATYGSAFVKDDWEEGLYFAHSNDNSGPPKDVEEIKEILANIQAQYPDYVIEISTLDQFAQYALTKIDELPVVTEEIGDSWIHGVGTDPEKISHFRLLLALRDNWLADRTLTLNDSEYRAFSNELMLIPEHTWGINNNLYLPDYKNYLRPDFERAKAGNRFDFSHVATAYQYSELLHSINIYVRSGEAAAKASYETSENSWLEQRKYLDRAISHLSVAHQKEVFRKFAELEQVPVLATLPAKQAVIFGKVYQFGTIKCTFASDGSLIRLNVKNRALIEAGRSIGKFIYEKFDGKNFQDFHADYSRVTEDTGSWVYNDFGKRGIEAIPEIKHGSFSPFVVNSDLQTDEQLTTITFELAFEQADVECYGLPTQISIRYLIDHQKQTLAIQFRGLGKADNRMPEAYWLECSIHVNSPFVWKMNKLGTSLSPYEVVSKGNRQMHALDQQALHYRGADGEYHIESALTPLFSFGGRNLLNFKDVTRSLNDGIYNNLYNNVWGTNFPAWYQGVLAADLNISLAPHEAIKQ
jgi:hypothetical protein